MSWRFQSPDQGMQRDARAGLAIQRKRLQEILAERERNQSATP
jgi:hypothetical protein